MIVSSYISFFGILVVIILDNLLVHAECYGVSPVFEPT